MYSKEELFRIVLIMYEYLQIKSKNPPRTIKVGKSVHKKAVEGFIDSLPPDSGVMFIWDFLVFQFYIYSTQIHERRPMPSWFMGREAWKRWNEYDEGARWHSQEWVRENKLVNPVLENKFKKVSDDVLNKERLRMSRISGPNFCFMKYGEEVFSDRDEICITCPFFSDCEILTKNISGVSIFQEVEESIKNMCAEEKRQVSGSSVVIRNLSRRIEYGEEGL